MLQHEIRNNLDFEAAETYMRDNPEKVTPEGLEEWSRSLASRTNVLRPFIQKAWRANGEWCFDVTNETVLVQDLAGKAQGIAYSARRDQKEFQIYQAALLLRGEMRLDRLHTQALWKLNEAITFPKKSLPDVSLSRGRRIGD